MKAFDTLPAAPPEALPPRNPHASRSKVVWSEGMYLRPQHFQQLERYVEGYVQQRCRSLEGPFWGFATLDLDPDALALGKVTLLGAQGVFPDGSPFDLTSADDLPSPLDIPANADGELVVLAWPVQRAGAEDILFEEQSESIARYGVCTCEVADTNAVALGPATLDLARPRVRLALASQLGGEWQALGVARVRERLADNRVVLDPRYIPPMLVAGSHPVLQGYAGELHGLLEQRAQALAQRIAQPAREGVAEVAEFLLLALVNRALADTSRALSNNDSHPHTWFREWLRLAFELSTYTSDARTPALRPVYRHDDLQASFAPLMAQLRTALSIVLEQHAVALPLHERAHRVWVAEVPSLDLLRDAGFVLAVQAELPADTMRSRFPAQIKIGPVERLADLVHLQLPGIGLRLLPAAPRQIPYHAGFHYFELETAGDLWKQLEQSAGLALHVAGELPGLTMTCWAIRR